MKLSCALVFTLTNLVIATPFSFSTVGSGTSAKVGAAAVPFGTFGGGQRFSSNAGGYYSAYSKPYLSFTSSSVGSNLGTQGYNGAQAAGTTSFTTQGQSGNHNVLATSQVNKNFVTGFGNVNGFSATIRPSVNTENTGFNKQPLEHSNDFHVDISGSSKFQVPHLAVNPVKKPSSYFGVASPVIESHEISKSNEENIVTSSKVPYFSNQNVISGSVYPSSNTFASLSNGVQSDSRVAITASDVKPTVDKKPIYNGGFGGPPGVLTPFDKGSSIGSNQANNEYEKNKQVEQLSASIQSKPQGFSYISVSTTKPSHTYANEGPHKQVTSAQTFYHQDQGYVSNYPNKVSSSNSDVQHVTHTAPETPENLKPQSDLVGNTFASTPVRPGQYAISKPNVGFIATEPIKNDQVYVHVYSDNVPFSISNTNIKPSTQDAPESQEKNKLQSTIGGNTFVSTSVRPGQYNTPKPDVGYVISGSRFEESKPIKKDQVYEHVYPSNVQFSLSNANIKPEFQATPEFSEKLKPQSAIVDNNFPTTPVTPGQYETSNPNVEFYTGAVEGVSNALKPTAKPSFDTTTYQSLDSGSATAAYVTHKPTTSNTYIGQYGIPSTTISSTSETDNQDFITTEQTETENYTNHYSYKPSENNLTDSKSPLLVNGILSEQHSSTKPPNKLTETQTIEYSQQKPNSYYPDGTGYPLSSLPTFGHGSNQLPGSFDKTKLTNQFVSTSQYKPSYTGGYEVQSGVVNPSNQPIQTGSNPVSSNTLSTYKPFVTESPFGTTITISEHFAGSTPVSSSADSVSKFSDSPNTPATSRNPSYEGGYAVSTEDQKSPSETSSNAYLSTTSVGSTFNHNSFSGIPQSQLSTKPIIESVPQKKPVYSNTFGTLTGTVKPSTDSYTSVTSFPYSTPPSEFGSTFVSGSYDNPKQTNQFSSTTQYKPTFSGSFGEQTGILNPTSQPYPTGSTVVTSNTLSTYKPLNATKQSSLTNQKASQLDNNFESATAFPKPENHLLSSNFTYQLSANSGVASSFPVTPKPTAADNLSSQTYTDTISGSTSLNKPSSEGSKATVTLSEYSDKQNPDNNYTQNNPSVLISSEEQKPVSQTAPDLGSTSSTFSSHTKPQYQFSSQPATQKNPWYSNTYGPFTVAKPTSYTYPGFSSSFTNFGHSSSVVTGSFDKTKQTNQYTSTGQYKPSYNWGFTGQFSTLKPSNQPSPTGSTFVSSYTSSTFKPFVSATSFDKLKPSSVSVTGQKESSFASGSGPSYSILKPTNQPILGETAYQTSNTETTTETFVTPKPTASLSSVSHISYKPISGSSSFSGYYTTPQATTKVVSTTPKYEIQKPFDHQGQTFSNEGSSLENQSYYSTIKPTTEFASLEKLDENSGESKPLSQSPINDITPTAQSKPSYTGVYDKSWSVKPSSNPILSQNAVEKTHQPSFDSTSYTSFDKNTSPSLFTTIKPTSFVSSEGQTVSALSTSSNNENSHFESSIDNSQQYHFNKHVDSNIPNPEYSEQQTNKPASEITPSNEFISGYSEPHPTTVASTQNKPSFASGFGVFSEAQKPSSQSFSNSAVYQTNEDFSSSAKPGTPPKRVFSSLVGGSSGEFETLNEPISDVSASSSAGFEYNSGSVSGTIDKSNSEYKPFAVSSSHISPNSPTSYKPLKPEHFDTSKYNIEVSTSQKKPLSADQKADDNLKPTNQPNFDITQTVSGLDSGFATSEYTSTSSSDKADKSKVSGYSDKVPFTTLTEQSSYKPTFTTGSVSGSSDTQNVTPTVQANVAYPYVTGTVYESSKLPSQHLSSNEASSKPHIQITVVGHPSSTTIQPPYAGGFGGPAGILKPNDFSVPSHHVNTPVTYYNQGSNAASYHGGFGGSPGVLNPNENGKPFFSKVQGIGFHGSTVVNRPHYNPAPNAPFAEAHANFEQQSVFGAHSTANPQVSPTGSASSSGFIDSNVHNGQNVQNLGNPVNYGASGGIGFSKNSNTHNGQIGGLYGFGSTASGKSSTGTTSGFFGIGKRFA